MTSGDYFAKRNGGKTPRKMEDDNEAVGAMWCQKLMTDFARHKINELKQMDKADGKSGWIGVKDRLPDIEQPVWMLDAGNIMMGCRSDYDGEGIVWCRIDELHHEEIFRKSVGYPWDFTPHHDDDYQPSHWQPLPEKPEDL